MFQLKANLTFWTATVVAAILVYSGMTIMALFVVALLNSREEPIKWVRSIPYVADLEGK